MTEIEALQEFWPQMLAAAGLIVWFVRLEGKVSANAKRLDDGLEFKAEVRKDLNDLKGHMTELMTDMKWLKELGSKLLKKDSE